MVFEYIFRRVGAISLKWFGTTNFASVNYSIYLIACILPLNLKYLRDQKILRKIYPGLKVFGVCILLTAVVSLVYDGYLLRKDVKRLTYSLTSSVLFIGTLIRITFLLVRQDELEECLDQLNNNFYIETIGKDERDEDFIERGEKFLKNLFKIFYGFFMVSLISRTICHLLPSEKMLMLPFPFVGDVESPTFEILFLLQTLGLSHFALIVMSHELIIFSSMVRILVHFEILTKNISEIAKLYPEHDYYNMCSSGEKSVKGEVLLNKSNCPEIVKYRLMFGDSYQEKSWNHESFINWREEKCFGMMREGIIHHQNLLNAPGSGKINNEDLTLLKLSQAFSLSTVASEIISHTLKSADEPIVIRPRRRRRNQRRNFRSMLRRQLRIFITTRVRQLFDMSLLCQIIGGGLLLVLSFVDVIWQSKRLSSKTYAQALYALTTLSGITVSYFLGAEMEARVMELGIQSLRAANELYAVPWTHMRRNNRQIFVIFLKALWKFPFLKGGFIKINLISYLKFMNMNYNLVAFMLNTARRE